MPIYYLMKICAMNSIRPATIFILFSFHSYSIFLVGTFLSAGQWIAIEFQIHHTWNFHLLCVIFLVYMGMGIQLWTLDTSSKAHHRTNFSMEYSRIKMCFIFVCLDQNNPVQLTFRHFRNRSKLAK